MNHDWQRVSRSPAGGSVLQICISTESGKWLSSPAGLFRFEDEGWRMQVHGLPFAQPGALLVREKTLLASGLAGGIFRSADCGATWRACRVDQFSGPVTCFYASPNFGSDGVVLAGTAGDGVLRSRDGGRSWEHSNFGLRDFNLLSLASGPEWGRREPVYAGSEGGLYYSPNGGRGWKPCGLGDKVVLAIALVHAGTERVLYAGLENEGLFRSSDGGDHWEAVDLGVSGEVSVNCILPYERHLLLGTSEYGLLRGLDSGTHLETIESVPGAVLSLAAEEGCVLAGTSDDGLWSSRDGGRSWSQEQSLAARRFHAMTGIAEDTWVLLSLDEGIWRAQGRKTFWSRVESWPGERSAFILRADQEDLYLAAMDGVWASKLEMKEWRCLLEAPEGISALFARNGDIVAASSTGRLWRSADHGAHWMQLETPVPGVPASGVLLTAMPESALYLAAAAGSRHEAQVWRAREDGSWECGFSERTDWKTMLLTAGGADGDQILVCTGEAVYRQSPQGWLKAALAPDQQPAWALAWDPGEKAWLLSAGEGFWRSPDGAAWTPEPGWLKGNTAAAIAASPGQDPGRATFALSLDGVLWRRSRRE